MSIKSTLPLFLLAGLVAAAPAGAAVTYTIDENHTEASFQVRHLGISNVRGRFGDLAGTIRIDREKPQDSAVELTIQAASIDTGVADRDKDLRSANFFDVEKFPSISFKSSKVVPQGGDRYDVTGTLTIHGVSKEVTLPVTHLGFVKDPWGHERVGFELATTLNRKDYGLVWNKALEAGGFLIGDEVKISVNLEAIQAKPATAK
jgi:polyisoprenoid-binding protein YceI